MALGKQSIGGARPMNKLADDDDIGRGSALRRKSALNPLWVIAAAMAVFFGLMTMLLID